MWSLMKNCLGYIILIHVKLNLPLTLFLLLSSLQGVATSEIKKQTNYIFPWPVPFWCKKKKSLQNKITKCIGILCKARKFTNAKSLIIWHSSFIYPYITSGVEADCKIAKENCQNNDWDHTDRLFKLIEILPFSKVYSYCVTKFMFQCVKKLVPSALRGMFPTNEDMHSYP